MLPKGLRVVSARILSPADVGGQMSKILIASVLAIGVGFLVVAFLFYRHRAQQVAQPMDADFELMGKSKRVSRHLDKQ